MNILGLSSGSRVINGHSEDATAVQRSAPPGGQTDSTGIRLKQINTKKIHIKFSFCWIFICVERMHSLRSGSLSCLDWCRLLHVGTNLVHTQNIILITHKWICLAALLFFSLGYGSLKASFLH